jgi:hypothetical protein
VLEDLPEVFSERSPPHALVRLRYQRALLYGDVYARLVRLHRPFLSRGYNNGSPFRYSTEQCVQAARSIIESNYELLSITTSHWWSELVPLDLGFELAAEPLSHRSVHGINALRYRAVHGPIPRH